MKTDLLGIKINVEPKQAVLEEIASRLNQGQSIFIVTPYSESIVAAQQDREFRNILNAADYALPDGIGILWAAKYLNLPLTTSNFWPLKIVHALWQLIYSLATIIFYPRFIRIPIPEKIPGSDFVWDLAAIATQKHYSVFILGGFSDTPELTAQKLKAKFPDLTVAGTYSGQPTEEGIEERINVSKADFLFCAFGPISQEKWLARHLPNLKIKLAIGLGGTFDYLAGKRPVAPKFWAFRGLEWLWRLLTQPWRLKRIVRGVFGLFYYSFAARLK